VIGDADDVSDESAHDDKDDDNKEEGVDDKIVWDNWSSTSKGDDYDNKKDDGE
jgi:hypothetical protein